MSTDIAYDTLLNIFQACEEEVQLAKKDTGKDDHLAAIYESTYRTVIGKELQKRGLDTWTMKIRGARIMLEINFPEHGWKRFFLVRDDFEKNLAEVMKETEQYKPSTIWTE